MSRVIEGDLEDLRHRLSDLQGKIKDKTFLVTGGAGFLGSWFCDVINIFGGSVICVDNVASGSRKNIEHLIGKDNFVFVEGNVLDFEPAEKVNYIVHMASIASPPLYMKHPLETLDANIFGTKRLLELAKKMKVDSFLFMSTSEIYGNPPDDNIPTSENFYGLVNSFGTRSMYDEGKRAAEAYCYFYFKEHGVPVRVSRTFNTYGPRIDVESTSQYGRVLIKFVHQAVRNQPITVYGDGTQTRSFCYITDQIEGLFRLLLTPGLDGQVFNIGNPEEYNILDLAKIVISTTNSKSKIQTNSKPDYDLNDDPRRRCPDITRVKRAFDYNPKIKLEDGIKRVVSWMGEKSHEN